MQVLCYMLFISRFRASTLFRLSRCISAPCPARIKRIDLIWVSSEKNLAENHQDKIKLAPHNRKLLTRRKCNTHLCKFLYFCNDKEATSEGHEKFNQILLRHILYIFDNPSMHGRGDVDKVTCIFQFYIPERKEKLPLLRHAMICWAHLNQNRQQTSCPHDLTSGTAYYMQRISRFNILVAVLLAFDCRLPVKEIRRQSCTKFCSI